MKKTPTQKEAALMKAMLGKGMTAQDILAHFSHPLRSLNIARIYEIKNRKLHSSVSPASQQDVDSFLASWPSLDFATGLHLEHDERLIKAREAMFSAIREFNAGGAHFRVERFVVIAMIAWTYLLHAYYDDQGIDIKYKEKGSKPARYWDLSQCLKFEKCPLEKSVIDNILVILDLRHVIEHEGGKKVDEALSPYLQACCLNFNSALKNFFGAGLSLEKEISIALQLVTFDLKQSKQLLGADLPASIQTVLRAHNDALSEEEGNDPQYRYRVALVPLKGRNPKTSEASMVLLDPDSPEAKSATLAIERPVEREKYRAKDIVKGVHKEKIKWFKVHHHTYLWQELDAKNPKHNYGVDVLGQWYWYESWLKKVLEKLNGGWKPPASKAEK